MISRRIPPVTILYITDGNLYQLLILHSWVDLSEVVPALIPYAVPGDLTSIGQDKQASLLHVKISSEKHSSP